MSPDDPWEIAFILGCWFLFFLTSAVVLIRLALGIVWNIRDWFRPDDYADVEDLP